MLRDVYWRQYPVDLLTDEKMACVEDAMPENYKHAPYMFYITALKLCDDNGIFDLDDGAVFARLMRLKDVKIVFDIANLMRKYKIIYRLSDEMMLCGLIDWTYSDKKPRTQEERRRAVMAVIEKEKAKVMSQKDFSQDGCAGKCNDIPQSDSCAGRCNDIPQASPTENSDMGAVSAPQTDAFSCAENDKKAKNVVMGVYDDKNAKNVVNTQYNTVHTDNTDSTTHNTGQKDNTNTHTDRQPPDYRQLEGLPSGDCKDKAAVADNLDKKTTKNKDPTQKDAADSASLAALALGNNQVMNSEDSALEAYLDDFFVKNCYGFKKKQASSALQKLCEEIKAVSDEMNPAKDVAAVLCGEFKKMCDGVRGNYWKSIPLLPSNMLKPRVWQELMQHAGKILASKASANKFLAAAEKAKQESLAEGDAKEELLAQEYRKYGINPADPCATTLLVQAKSRESKAQQMAEKAPEPEYDIF